MSIFDDFTTFNFSEGVPYVSITKNGLTFNKAVIMKLGYPRFVNLLISKERQMIAIRACHENDPSRAAFYNADKSSNILSVRWNHKDLLNTISSITGWILEEESFRVDGELIEEERAMLFNLAAAKRLG